MPLSHYRRATPEPRRQGGDAESGGRRHRLGREGTPGREGTAQTESPVQISDTTETTARWRRERKVVATQLGRCPRAHASYVSDTGMARL